MPHSVPAEASPSPIYLISPSGAVAPEAPVERALANLRQAGFAPVLDRTALRIRQRFAGSDDDRVGAFARAAAQPAPVVMITRGGYGLTRILPGIVYKKIAKAIEGGTQFVGLSDFTAFQLALLAKTGAISWAGPALGEDFGVEGEPDDIMEACFDDLVLDQGEGAGWRLPIERASKTPESIGNNDPFTLGSGQKTIKDAVLWGGNLSVLVSLLGTPYWPEVKGGVLFIEDVNEHPFRIERMLTQLLHAGVLARQKAVVFGQFTGIRLAPHDRGYKLATVVAWLRSQIKVPVLTGLPFGHVPTKVLLPVGAKVDLLVEGRDALMVWGHL